MDVEQTDSAAEITVRNMGGIDQTEVAFEPGVTVLAGRNATNRTSFLQAIMAALGSDDVSMKADADKAYVELVLNRETYTRTLERRNGTPHLSGEPYLDDSTLGDLFAFLLESNEARQAVVTDADLRDIIMRPVDTDKIQAEIDRLLEERRQVSNELDELEDLKSRLPKLEEQRTQLQNETKEKKAELEDIEAEIEAHDANVEESQEEQEEIETKLEELRETRAELDEIRYDLETEQESLESLRAEKQEVEEAHNDLAETSADELKDLETRIDQLRTQKQQLEAELTDIQSVIGFNQEQLEESTETFAEVFDDDNEGAVTDELLPEETVTCWTCGSEVETGQIETTIERLQEVSQDLVGEINDLEGKIEELTDERREIENKQRRRKQFEQRREELETELDETKTRIEKLSDQRDDLREEVEAIETEVENLESDAYTEILDLHKEANQLEYDLGRLENDLERVEENITSLEHRLDSEAELKARRDKLSNEIDDLRTRIERIEKKAVDQFNNHMEMVLELLEYDNLARIWLERRETEVRDGRQKVTKNVFDLHVIRQAASGATFEDTVDNLSESEREVTGLIFALSGYLAHDVYERVPFMLLDSVEAIDADRISTLIEYFEDYSEYLVVALLPEDAAGVNTDYQTITEI